MFLDIHLLTAIEEEIRHNDLVLGHSYPLRLPPELPLRQVPEIVRRDKVTNLKSHQPLISGLGSISVIRPEALGHKIIINLITNKSAQIPNR